VYDKSQVIFAFLFLFSQAFYFDSISGLTYLNFRESSVLVTFRNESLASRRRFFAQSTSTADAARLVSLVQSPGCSLSQPSLRHTTFLGSCKNNQPTPPSQERRKKKNVKMDMLLLLDVGDGKQIYRDKIHDYEPGLDALRTWHAATRTGSYTSGHLSRKPVPGRPAWMLWSSTWSMLNVQRSGYCRS
jgi:hypothetical protein